MLELEYEQKLKREMAELDRQNMLETQAKNEEIALRGVEHMTLSDIPNDEIRARAVKFVQTVDGLHSDLVTFQNHVDKMKKGSSWLGTQFGGGSSKLGDNDQVLFTKAQALEHNSNIQEKVLSLACDVMVLFQKLGITDVDKGFKRRRDEASQQHKIQSDRVDQWERKSKRKYMEEKKLSGCDCAKTKCTTKSCKCVKSGQECSSGCYCKGGVLCNNPLKKVEYISDSDDESPPSYISN